MQIYSTYINIGLAYNQSLTFRIAYTYKAYSYVHNTNG